MHNRIKFYLLLTGLLLAGNSVAGEHGTHQDRMHQRGGPGGPGMAAPVIQHLTRAIRHLDLSAEQEESIHADLQGLRGTLTPLVMELHEAKRELMGLITASEYDADAVAINAEKQGNLTAEITMIASDAASAVLAQLSEEQRAELKAMGEERRARREGHRERAKERRGPGASDGG